MCSNEWFNYVVLYFSDYFTQLQVYLTMPVSQLFNSYTLLQIFQ